jgi:hypothetical protein
MDDRRALLAQCEAAYQQCKDVYAGKPMQSPARDEAGMPEGVSDSAARQLYLTPGGLYTEADIAANQKQTAAQRYRGFRSKHDMNPAAGSYICPITRTKANPQCTWIVAGKEYQFCCPPCIDEFVRQAKESPEAMREPDEYIKP